MLQIKKIKLNVYNNWKTEELKDTTIYSLLMHNGVISRTIKVQNLLTVSNMKAIHINKTRSSC